MASLSADTIDLNDFDPFNATFRQDPERFHPALVNASPGFVEVAGVPSAYVARYPQLTAIFRNFKAFSSVKPKGLPGMERVDFFNGLPVMTYSDPPDHTRRRKVVNPAFTPKRTQLLNDAASAQIDKALEVAAARGRLEAVSDLTRQLAIETLLDRLLGVAKEDQGIFFRYFEAMPLLDKMKPGDPKPQPFLDVWEEGQAYCQRQLQLARAGKCDSLIGLIASSVDDGTIAEDEMMAMMIVLLAGGVSTLAAASASSLLYLARNPDVAERIRQDPALADHHLEETLRLDTPVSFVLRFGMEGSEIAGKTIPKGMPVYLLLPSANRDPEVFPDPNRFSLDRPNIRDHLAFGQGMHTCIGNGLTRNIIPLLIRKFVAKFKDIAIADVPDAVHYNVANPRTRHLERLVLEVG